tara:strand:+ start:984 stop:1874 length:891 start_codon:yes stop_codon:yes gene_type:complete
MSLRERRRGQSSVYGTAIGTPNEGFWSPMAVSPPRPRSWSFALNPEPDAVSVTIDRLTIAAQSDDDDEVPVLDSVVPLWLHDLSAPGTAMVLFDEAPTPEPVPLQSTPRRLRVRAPVAVRKVAATSLSWQPLVEDGVEVGYAYALGSGSSDATGARVEVRVPGSIAVIQGDYSPLCASTGMCLPSSLLLFADPEAHLDSMRDLRAQLGRGEDIGYIPTQELCVTSALDKLVLRTNGAESGDRNDEARRAWQQTKAFLKGLSTVTADCIASHANNEIARTRAFELSRVHALWRANVI